MKPSSELHNPRSRSAETTGHVAETAGHDAETAGHDEPKYPVLIVAIGLIGYLSYKLFSGKAGTIIGGMLGGLISSTATTVAYARRARGTRGWLAVAAVIIGIAWAVSVARVIAEVMVVVPTLMLSVVPPLAVPLLPS